MERRLSTRLLLVNPSPVRGGAEELLIAFCTRTTRVQPLVANLADGPFPDDLSRAGVATRALRAGRLRNPAAWARAVGRLARLARDADAVLSWQVKGHYYGTPAARAARRAAAWWDHGIRPVRGEPRYAVDHLLPASFPADLVVCSSAAAAARHARARAILPGIDLSPYDHVSRPDARALLDLPDDVPVVGTVGRLQPWKGQHVFLRAAALVLKQHPTAVFVVAGGTPGGFSATYPDELRALAADLGIAEQVRFLGHRDDVPSLLPAFDVFVLPSFAEPFGLVTVEAMAAGVPVVATEAGGVPEIVTDGETGLLVPLGDEAVIADRVCWVLADEVLAGRLAGAGRARARERFSIARFVAEVEDMVIDLAGRRR